MLIENLVLDNTADDVILFRKNKKIIFFINMITKNIYLGHPFCFPVKKFSQLQNFLLLIELKNYSKKIPQISLIKINK